MMRDGLLINICAVLGLQEWDYFRLLIDLGLVDPAVWGLKDA